MGHETARLRMRAPITSGSGNVVAGREPKNIRRPIPDARSILVAAILVATPMHSTVTARPD